MRPRWHALACGVRRIEHAGPADLAALQSFAARLFAATGYHSPGDLAWNESLSYDRPAENPTAVWQDAGEIRAFGWVEQPSGLMMLVDPRCPELAAEVLSWAEMVADEPLEIPAADTETTVTRELSERGYRVADGPFFSCLSRPLTDSNFPADLRSPSHARAGFQMREVTDLDAQGWVDAHVLAFPGSRFDLARRRYLTKVPLYDRRFDLAVFMPDGRLAAYCLGWYDEQNKTGEFEPVGTHPEYRRRGLAAAVCAAVLARFRAVGGERAVVNARGDAAYPAPKALYESLGFREHTRTRTWYRVPGNDSRHRG